MKAAIGIDPGQTGALALVAKDTLILHDFDTIKTSAAFLSDLTGKYDIQFAILEKAWIRPQERNPASTTRLIRSAAMWDTLLHVLEIDHEEYSPATWRKGLVFGKGKKAAVKAAVGIFGNEAAFKRHDRAEAALMAYRAYRHIDAGWQTKKGVQYENRREIQDRRDQD